ncbi:MAG: hypothetical protein E7554_04800 [Ruminococcaceae bacterium]|nr:hypothetical protein [Oscillospiraceae bacterium]
MDNQNAPVPELKLYAYDSEYARSKKTGSHYWTVDLILALALLAAVGVAYLLRNVIPSDSPMYTPFIVGILAAAVVVYLIFKGAMSYRTDAWFCSFAQRDGRLFHLEFSPRQGIGLFGTLFDAAHCSASIKAAADPEIVGEVLSYAAAGARVPASTKYRNVTVTELHSAALTLKGKKVIANYFDRAGKQRKLVTADCFKGLAEDFCGR